MIIIFSEDRAYGELVKRFSNGTVTNKNIDLINTSLLNDGCGNGGKLELSEKHQIYITHVERMIKKSITTSIFRNLIEETHPIADNDDCIS